MSKLRKTQKRLEKRLSSWNNITNKDVLRSQGMNFNKPGSQNHKK